MRFSEQCTDPEVGRMLGALEHDVFYVLFLNSSMRSIGSLRTSRCSLAR